MSCSDHSGYWYAPRSRHPDGLLQAKSCAADGLCLFCEEPLPPAYRRPRLICGSRACRLAYIAAWRRDRRFRGAA